MYLSPFNNSFGNVSIPELLQSNNVEEISFKTRLCTLNSFAVFSNELILDFMIPIISCKYACVNVQSLNSYLNITRA